MRPLGKEEEGVQIVQKTSPNSISILEHSFSFDSVADESSTQVGFLCSELFLLALGKILMCSLFYFLFYFNGQHDIFQLVGLPLVENCLAGFNSSIFAYGQVNLAFCDNPFGLLLI